MLVLMVFLAGCQEIMLSGVDKGSEAPVIIIFSWQKIHRLAEIGVPLAKGGEKVRMDQYCKMELNILEQYYF
jgi:hypothetical protein